MAVGDSGLCDGGVRDGTPLVAATIAGVRDIGGIIGAAGGAAAGDAFTICGAGAAITAPALDPRDAAAVGSRRSEPCLAVRRDAAAPDGDAPAAGLAGGGSVAIETGDAAGVASDVAATEAGCGSTTAGATAAATAKPRPAAVGAAAASACRKPPDVALIAGVEGAPASDVAILNGLAGGASGSNGWL